MNAENQTKGVRVKRWLDVALLAYTLTGPFVNTLFKRLRRGEQQAQTGQEDGQADVRQRLNALTLESRQWVAEQVQQLSEQAQQLQAQSRQLRKALRREARQRRKLLAQMRESGIDLSKDVLKRGEHLSEELAERGGKLTQGLLERGSKVAQDLAQRSGEFTQELAERGGMATHELAKRSGKVTHELAERGERLLEPVRKRDRNFWTIVGFSVGLVVAGIVTYRLVRHRVVQQEMEQEERIELPQSETRVGTQNRPAGEIRHFDLGTSVATLEMVDLEIVERPADAAFVGVVVTKLYYPIDTDFELEDVVYFISEEEARAQGFTSAE